MLLWKPIMMMMIIIIIIIMYSACFMFICYLYTLCHNEQVYLSHFEPFYGKMREIYLIRYSLFFEQV